MCVCVGGDEVGSGRARTLGGRERYWEYKEFVKEKTNKVGRKWIEDDRRKTG